MNKHLDGASSTEEANRSFIRQSVHEYRGSEIP